MYMNDEEPPGKRKNYGNSRDIQEINYSSQPSTSRGIIQEKIPRKSENREKAIEEAAKRNGMDTVNRSGSSFVVPLTIQAYPTQLTDRVLSEKDDILSQSDVFPYCCHCNSIIKTWRGFEYHVLQVHVKYRPYRCFHCTKEHFYTEEEGRFHLSTAHPNQEMTLIKKFEEDKERAARDAFQYLFLICRDGAEITKDRVAQWEIEAKNQIMKFHYLKFKRPIVVVKKLPQISGATQTDPPHKKPVVPIPTDQISLNDSYYPPRHQFSQCLPTSSGDSEYHEERRGN